MLIHLKTITLLLIFTFLFTGCIPKENGKYDSKYSYHPYYDLYAKKMLKKTSKKVVKSKKKSSKAKKSKISLNNNSRFPNNLSKK